MKLFVASGLNLLIQDNIYRNTVNLLTVKGFILDCYMNCTCNLYICWYIVLTHTRQHCYNQKSEYLATKAWVVIMLLCHQQLLMLNINFISFTAVDIIQSIKQNWSINQEKHFIHFYTPRDYAKCIVFMVCRISLSRNK